MMKNYTWKMRIEVRAENDREAEEKAWEAVMRIVYNEHPKLNVSVSLVENLLSPSK